MWRLFFVGSVLDEELNRSIRFAWRLILFRIPTKSLVLNISGDIFIKNKSFNKIQILLSPKFFMGPHMIPGKGYKDAQIYKDNRKLTKNILKPQKKIYYCIIKEKMLKDWQSLNKRLAKYIKILVCLKPINGWIDWAQIFCGILHDSNKAFYWRLELEKFGFL